MIKKEKVGKCVFECFEGKYILGEMEMIELIIM